MKTTLPLLAFLVFISSGIAIPPALPESDFEDGLQGWTRYEPFNGVLRLSGVGQGHPGRAMEVADDCSGCGGLRVRAPSPFQGDLSRYAGIRWDELVPNYGADTLLRTTVMLRSGNGTMYTGTNPPLGSLGSWVTRFAPFVSNAWVLSSGTESFADVLTDVQALLIRMDTSVRAGGALESRVDNVVLVPLETRTSVRASQVQVCWNSRLDRSYQIQYRSDLTANQWTDLGAPHLGNGATNCIVEAVAPGERQRFYRVATPQGILAQSTFDSNSEGWRVVDRSFGTLTEISTRTPAFRPADGNPGGFIQISDGTGASNGDWRWRAPAQFLGDQSAAYGGRIEFDVISDLATTPVSAGMALVLIGGGITNTSTFVPTPARNVWTHYSVPLMEGVWTNAATSLPSSAPELAITLSALVALDLPGEFGTGLDTGGLDNVTLFAGGPVLSIRLSQFEICWNSQAGRPYQVQYRSALTGNLWADLGVPELGNGSTNCIQDAVAPGEPRRSYRVITRP